VHADAAGEMVPPPAGGRIYEMPMRPGLADCAPSGRMRLDGLARWLQDVAYADVEDAGLAQSAVWVVRKNRITVARFPRFAEHFTLRTFCSGLGRMWAERRTTITSVDDGTVAVEAVSLWVHLDPSSWRPAPFTKEEVSAYGDAAGSRRISARLRHPAPPPGLEPRDWRFRVTDCDIAAHVNNAAYWQPLEEELVGSSIDPERLDVEMEFRSPAQPGGKQIIRSGDRWWIVDPGGETHASLVVLAGL
jgi:acyl-ACP thioesterase